MARTDRHNEIEINLLGNGTLTYLFGGKKILVPSNRIVTFWAVIPHQVIDFENLNDYYVLTIPLTTFLQLELPSFFVQKILQGQLIFNRDVNDQNADEIRFEQWVTDIVSDNEERKRICLLEIEARLRRFIYNLESNENPNQSKSFFLKEGDLSNVEKMALFIAENYKEPLTVDDVANSVKLHPNYAMKLFRKTIGKTIMEYITEHRLSHAQKLLITSDNLILDIALDSGFGSLSRFNIAFKKVLNCTPRSYRNNFKIHRFPL